MAPAGAGARRTPWRAVDDWIPADPGDIHPLFFGEGDLVQDVLKPMPLVETGMAPVMDRMPIVPTCFRHYHGFTIAAPRLQQDL